MKARIKLRPASEKKQAPQAPVPQGKRFGEKWHQFGQRWCAGESIRKLAAEAGIEWNELQANLRSAGYLRSHRGVVIPN